MCKRRKVLQRKELTTSVKKIDKNTKTILQIEVYQNLAL